MRPYSLSILLLDGRCITNKKSALYLRCPHNYVGDYVGAYGALYPQRLYPASDTSLLYITSVYKRGKSRLSNRIAYWTYGRFHFCRAKILLYAFLAVLIECFTTSQFPLHICHYVASLCDELPILVGWACNRLFRWATNTEHWSNSCLIHTRSEFPLMSSL
jgi:hypothetical protein